MIREVIEKLVGSSTGQPLYSSETANAGTLSYRPNYIPQHCGHYGGGYEYNLCGPTPAQKMIEKGRHKDKKYGYMYGDYYEKRARKKAAKIYGSGHSGNPGLGYGGPGGHDPAQALIEEGRYKDHKVGYMYGDYYEKRARKKARRMYGGY